MKDKLSLFHLLVHSTEQSTSWEANRSSAGQEIPHILWNLKFYYRIHKCPQHAPTLNHIDPVRDPHTTPEGPS